MRVNSAGKTPNQEYVLQNLPFVSLLQSHVGQATKIGLEAFYCCNLYNFLVWIEAIKGVWVIALSQCNFASARYGTSDPASLRGVVIRNRELLSSLF